VSPEEFPGVVAGDGFYFGLVNGVGRIGERRGEGEVKALRLRVVSGFWNLPSPERSGCGGPRTLQTGQSGSLTGLGPFALS
jgi:hypothetical protein